jgi:hypothetical protein
MKEPERRSPRSTSEEVPGQSLGALDEARELLRRGMDEVERQAESGREAARARGPLARVLLGLTIAACLSAVGAGVYGVYNFPDAPIRQAAGGYVGKYGKPHTREEFEAFVLWKSVMFVAFPSAFVLGFAFALADGAGRRRRKS